jgi:hypothetical protein
MNNQRRKELYKVVKDIISLLEGIKQGLARENIVCIVEDLIKEIESIQWDEEYYMDNIPENLQGGHRYEAAEEACDNMGSAIDYLGTIMENEELTIEETFRILTESMNYINCATA